MELAPLLYRLPGVWPGVSPKGQTVNPDDVIGLFDLDTATQSKITRDFLRKAEAAGGLHLALRPGASELPRVFLITCSGGAGSSTASTDVFFLTRLPR